MSAQQAFEKAFYDLIDESPSTALRCVTGAFVALTVQLAEQAGADTSLEILIDGGPARDVTIHPPKVGEMAAQRGVH